jgi:hypothetical protein
MRVSADLERMAALPRSGDLTGDDVVAAKARLLSG